MSAQSSIEWTDRTWNPVRGCSIVSPGCVNCYAMKQAHRFSGPRKPYHGLTKLTSAGPQWTGQIRTVEAALIEPLSWRTPARVFVNSMSDLFHEDVPEQFIVDVFGIMALAHWHTFQVLTKRPERMRQFLQSGDHGIVAQFQAIQQRGGIGPKGLFDALSIKRRDGVAWKWPLPNVWLGVSVEDQKHADERIPLLLQTPAAVRFISAEPLLGPIDFSMNPSGQVLEACDECGHRRPNPDCDACLDAPPALDWVIVGGESGPGARLFDIAWGRSIVQQCKAAGVPVFVKQIGSRPTARDAASCTDGLLYARFKSKKGGDPSEWPEDLRVRQFPEARA